LGTDVSAQPVGPVLKGTLKRVSIGVPETPEINYQRISQKIEGPYPPSTQVSDVFNNSISVFKFFKCIWRSGDMEGSGLDAVLFKVSLICTKSVTTKNLVFLSYWYRKRRLQMHF